MTTARVIQHGAGKLTITSLGPRCSWFVLEGVLGDDIGAAITEEGSRICARGDAVALHDWSRLGSYTSSARVKLTDWMLSNRRGFAEVHILVTSSLVAMGVNVANLALGGFLHAHTDARTFADVVERHRGTTR